MWGARSSGSAERWLLIELRQLSLAEDLVHRKFNMRDEVNKRAIL